MSKSMTNIHSNDSWNMAPSMYGNKCRLKTLAVMGIKIILPVVTINEVKNN